jgi:hypothetical protein
MVLLSNVFACVEGKEFAHEVQVLWLVGTDGAYSTVHRTI